MIPSILQELIQLRNRSLHIHLLTGLTTLYDKGAALSAQGRIFCFFIKRTALFLQNRVDCLVIKAKLNIIGQRLMLQIRQLLIPFDNISLFAERECFLHDLRIFPCDPQLSCRHFHRIVINRMKRDRDILQAVDIGLNSLFCLLLRHSRNIHIPDIDSRMDDVIVSLCHCHCPAHKQAGSHQRNASNRYN